MISRGIREFVSRDWRSVRNAKDAYWHERIAALGPGEALRIGDELRRQALLQNPGWPDPADREQDLLTHARVAALLRRARPTLATRHDAPHLIHVIPCRRALRYPFTHAGRQPQPTSGPRGPLGRPSANLAKGRMS